jgi:hypothetical protein
VGLHGWFRLGFPWKDTVSLNSAQALKHLVVWSHFLDYVSADNLSLSPSLVDRPLCWWFRGDHGWFADSHHLYPGINDTIFFGMAPMDYLWMIVGLIHGGCFAVEVEKAVRR